MNPSFWGSNGWNFLHNLPWLYENEVLSKKEAIDVIEFIHSFMQILPCSACSKSALQFEKHADLVNSLSFNIDGYLYFTRSRIAKYFYDLRNSVNMKLEKPVFGKSWVDSIPARSDPKLTESLCTFMLAAAWNYDKNESVTKRILFERFFTILLPRVIANTDIGKLYNIYLKAYDYKKTDGNRKRITFWAYGFRRSATMIIGYSPWTFEENMIFLSSTEARSACGDSTGCE
jgi:hypothetical protein